MYVEHLKVEMLQKNKGIKYFMLTEPVLVISQKYVLVQTVYGSTIKPK